MDSQNPQQQQQSSFAASPTPTANPLSGTLTGTVHKRTYQACLPCRRRKVRCDLGSVDEPGDPPCQRCRREKKDCVFSETRRKRRASEEGSDLTDEYVARNKRSAKPGDVADGGEETTGMRPGHPNGPVSYGLQGPDNHNRQLPAFVKKPNKGASNEEVFNVPAVTLFKNPIVQPRDAFSNLVAAANEIQRTDRKDSKSSTDREKLRETQAHRLSTSGTRPDLQSAIDPAIMAIQNAEVEADVTAALQAWSRLRFVQAGWFTPREAITYIDYFYEYLAPLTPISPPDFSNYGQHPRLLAEEPMLTVTLLTITSRYKKLDGPGAATRSAKVHDKLWDYLQGMITRMFWGQEQFGGGFCGAGASKTQEELEAKRRGLRSLGTAESLLLLSDWLPRSMHFPPGDNDGELLVPLPGSIDDNDAAQSANVHVAWTEPALRSDRMCWSLIGMAYTLSWELGVFDSLLETGVWCPGPQTKTVYDGERADRVGRMLLVYVSQACGRLGYPNMMPSQGNETNFNFLKMDIPQGTYPGPYGTITETDKIQRAWAELTALMRQSNTEMFESKARVHEAIQKASYFRFLEDWGPRMKEWKAKFDATEMPEKARLILLMEFEYTKTYIYSMSLQAVVESMAASNEEKEEGKNPKAEHTPPALFPSKVVEVHSKNRMYIEELIGAAREVLRIAAEKLSPVALKHAPVRTHFRILSAAMFLLKSFAIGGKESEVQLSLELLDKAVKALRTSVIDDVHLSLRIADLLDGLAKGISQRFQRLTVPSRNSNKRPAHAHRSSTSNPHPTSAPNSGSGTDRGASNNTSVRIPNANTSSVAGRNGTDTPPAQYTPGPNIFENFGMDDPPMVDLRDPNIKFMPPPDPNFGMSDFHNPTNTGPLSPHCSQTAGGGLGSPPIGNLKRPRNASFDAHNQMAFSPTQASFSPMSTGSGVGSTGGYDWLAVDFNPLLANTGVYYGGEHQHGHGHGAQGQGQHGHGQNQNAGGAGQMHDNQGQGMHEGDEGQGNIGASPWTMGAFGPEISEGLEMLGALGALVWEDPAQGQGQGGHGGGQWQ